MQPCRSESFADGFLDKALRRCKTSRMRTIALLPNRRRTTLSLWGLALVCLALAACPAPAADLQSAQTVSSVTSAPDTFSFTIAGDMRSFVGPAPAGKRYFDGACEALQSIGAGAFMISPGDCDPPGPVRADLDRYLGTNYLWYPLTGNHETGNPKTMAWLRRWAQAGIPHLVRRGPPDAEDTTFSFDFGNSHFVLLNEYYGGRAARKTGLPAAALDWLQADLAATRQPLVWVVGHKPLRSLPDMDTGRVRHSKESVGADAVHLARFVQLLQAHHVRAYICGHTHDCSVAKVHGLWQLDSGHARGGGDTGAPSTFLKVRVAGPRAWVDVYRADRSGRHYRLRKTVELD